MKTETQTPRTDDEICLDSDGNAVMWRGENVVTATFARKLELQIKDQQARFNGEAVGRILKHISKICGKCGGEITAVGCAQCWKDIAQKLAYHVQCNDSWCGIRNSKCDACKVLETFKQLDAPAEPSNGQAEARRD
jgi:hypothetical protein